jgi:hypothetical protein
MSTSEQTPTKRTSTKRATTPTPTPLELSAQSALEAIRALDLDPPARAIYEALAVGAYHTAAQGALASDRHRAHATPRGLIALLSATHPHSEEAHRAQVSLTEIMRAAERGTDTAEALRATRERLAPGVEVCAPHAPAGRARDLAPAPAPALALDDLSTFPTKSAAKRPPRKAQAPAHRAEPPAPGEERPAPAPAPRVVSLSDPTREAATLAPLIARLRVEYPPPMDTLDAIERRQRGGSGAPMGAARGAWLVWVEEIARAWPGPLTLSDLARLAPDAQGSFLASLWAERVELLRAGLDDAARRGLAGALLAEAEGVGREALALAQSSDDPRVKGAALKLSLDSIARRAALAGLDGARLSVEVSAAPTQTAEERLRAMGLDLAALARLGDAASQQLSAAGAGRKSES